jgi:uncharacterized phage protein gp47/JayE
MADELYIPQVDYTSRDYTSIREDLIALIPNFAPQWTSRDSSDFGIVLLELFSYVGDLVNYQIDRAANESFIDTATQRDTVIKLASLLGYTPNSASPATGAVTLTNNGTSTISIPALTILNTQQDITGATIYFTLDSAITSLAAGASTTANVTQGSIAYVEPLGNSDGSKSQAFPLSNTGVFTNTADTTMSVTVNGTTYTKTPYLIDYSATDLVYTTYIDGAGVTYIKFGDGVSGNIPPSGSVITATYRYSTTTPSLGNIPAGSLNVINVVDNVVVTNALAFSGGADEESTDSIRVNAPKSLRAINRAVSLSDYVSLALKVNGVSKANAIANAFSSVTLYIAAASGNPLSSSLSSSISSSFVNKMPPSTTLTVKDFTPAYPYLDITVNVLPQYNAANTKAAVLSALYSLFDFDNVSFNDLITEGDIYAACKAVEGVTYITVNDYEKLTANPNSTNKIYSQTGTVVSTATATTTVTLTSGTAGIFAGSTITSVNGVTTHAAVGRKVNKIGGSGLTLYLDGATTLAANDVLVVKGANGVVPGLRDLSCAINEVPILEKSYITITTSGGVL